MRESAEAGAYDPGLWSELVDRRGDLVVLDEVHEPVGVEVRHPDRLGEALAIDFLHRAPGAVVIAKRLVDQIDVDVVERQTL